MVFSPRDQMLRSRFTVLSAWSSWSGQPHTTAFTIRISNVEEGSPAASAGGLSKGQIVESINGYRRQRSSTHTAGNILAEAEAEDGLLRLLFMVNQNLSVKILS